jgi:hypothetical protein
MSGMVIAKQDVWVVDLRYANLCFVDFAGVAQW